MSYVNIMCCQPLPVYLYSHFLDGYISPAELAQALLSMGVKLDVHTMQQLWK